MLFKPLAFITIALSAFQVRAATTAPEIIKSLTSIASQTVQLQKVIDSLNASNLDTVAPSIPNRITLLYGLTKDLSDDIKDFRDLELSDNDVVSIGDTLKALISADIDLEESILFKQKFLSQTLQIEGKTPLLGQLLDLLTKDLQILGKLLGLMLQIPMNLVIGH
ncbi:hypothetical protein PT974_00206 [Cladobotryum mycophilum]|uniref:Uncharacterized protein n=1 Tax=Cladobotryum mycophilum TaxID=491253 RepID=A0ABR0T055_9HYPO